MLLMNTVTTINYSKRLTNLFDFMQKRILIFKTNLSKKRINSVNKNHYTSELIKLQKLSLRTAMLKGKLHDLRDTEVDFSNKTIISNCAKYFLQKDLEILFESESFTDLFMEALVKRISRSSNQSISKSTTTTESTKISITELPKIEVKKQQVNFTPVDVFADFNKSYEQMSIFDILQ
jgi:hypothetical protein